MCDLASKGKWIKHSRPRPPCGIIEWTSTVYEPGSSEWGEDLPGFGSENGDRETPHLCVTGADSVLASTTGVTALRPYVRCRSQVEPS